MRKVSSSHGYRVVFLGKTEAGNEKYQYEHILLAEKMIGRKLKKSETVHHLDFNRENNRYENLLVLSRKMHAKLHKWIEAGCPMLYHPFRELAKPIKPKRCKLCRGTLQRKAADYCTEECARFGSRKVSRPSRRKLRRLIKRKSWEAIGRKYGVSGNAVKKWARKYNLEIPMRRA